MSEREKLKPEENVKIVMKYIAGEVSIWSSSNPKWMTGM